MGTRMPGGAREGCGGGRTHLALGNSLFPRTYLAMYLWGDSWDRVGLPEMSDDPSPLSAHSPAPAPSTLPPPAPRALPPPWLPRFKVPTRHSDWRVKLSLMLP